VDYVEANRAARDRILALIKGRSEDELGRWVGPDWTVSAHLVHLAFWDRVHVGRLRHAIAAGLVVPPPLPDGLTDLINDASLPAWRAVPSREAVAIWERASADADAYLASLDPIAIEGVRSAGFPRLVERFRHRTEHGDVIAEVLTGRRS
jgi:hypothetical protein